MQAITYKPMKIKKNKGSQMGHNKKIFKIKKIKKSILKTIHAVKSTCQNNSLNNKKSKLFTVKTIYC
jgi:hypothetical protein